jgi:hypothetical protein
MPIQLTAPYHKGGIIHLLDRLTQDCAYIYGRAFNFNRLNVNRRFLSAHIG